MNRNILVTGGKESKNDFQSSGERKGKSPNRLSTDERGLGQREGKPVLVEGGRKAAPKRVKVP